MTRALPMRSGLPKTQNKARMAAWLKDRKGLNIDPTMMFDVQIKRIHEYKRQLLNLLETVALWNDIKDNPNGDWTPRLKVFAGKAAPGYVVAKEIIHLINDVAKVINADPVTRDVLQVIYPDNYNVTMAEVLVPAADLSEQISTAGQRGVWHWQHEICVERRRQQLARLMARMLKFWIASVVITSFCSA